MPSNKQQGLVLHTRPYRESSLLVELFTRDAGRLTVLAKGARRLKSPYRGTLRPFITLLLGWSGKGELPILTQAEALHSGFDLSYDRLWCGFYLNELLMRLLHRHDPHFELFDQYVDALGLLSTVGEYESVLRIFEKHLLKELGYALELGYEYTSGATINEDKFYRYVPTQGLTVCDPSSVKGFTISGRSVLALQKEILTDPLHLKESKTLMRYVIGYYLSGKPLHSRRGYNGIAKGENTT